jgi:hypothetical protein
MVLLLGCGAGTAGKKPENVAGACPGTLQEALEASCRGMGAIDECTYEEATCGCSPHPYCGGATPEPPGPDDPGKYRCTSVDPASPLLREDGCPLNMPMTGDPCTGEQVCAYAGCPHEKWEARCADGAWYVEDTYDGPLPM